jgi:hypothetical protein
MLLRKARKHRYLIGKKKFHQVHNEQINFKSKNIIVITYAELDSEKNE